MNLQQKIDYSINLLKKAEPLALQYNREGFYLAFSGGKDSQVIYELAKMADVKFQAHMNLTSVDPPQVLKFVRRNYPDVVLHRPEKSIYQLIPIKKCLPTRKIRWCCDVLKEQTGGGTATILGIRRTESVQRSKRNEMEISRHKYSGNFDQFSEHKETTITCVSGKDKFLLSPILNWLDHDVWNFLKLRNLPHCELYDMGYRRIGCVMCPMANKKAVARDRKMFPGIERAYKKAIGKLLIVHPECGKGMTVDQIFEWWVSKKNINEFIADEITQQKLDFFQ